MASAANVYTSVTLVPPPNWELAPIIINNVTISANGSGQYVCANISNASVAAMLSQGWTIAAFTA